MKQLKPQTADKIRETKAARKLLHNVHLFTAKHFWLEMFYLSRAFLLKPIKGWRFSTNFHSSMKS